MITQKNLYVGIWALRVNADLLTSVNHLVDNLSVKLNTHGNELVTRSCQRGRED